MNDVMKYILEEGMEKPFYGSASAAGIDIAISDSQVQLAPGQQKMIGTGLRVQIPEGHFGMIVPRSSTGKLRIKLANTIGIIDSDYQGEIKLLLENTGREQFIAFREDCLVQLIIVPYVQAKLMKVTEFAEKTERGEGGFGSTTKS